MKKLFIKAALIIAAAVILLPANATAQSSDIETIKLVCSIVNEQMPITVSDDITLTSCKYKPGYMVYNISIKNMSAELIRKEKDIFVRTFVESYKEGLGDQKDFVLNLFKKTNTGMSMVIYCVQDRETVTVNITANQLIKG